MSTATKTVRLPEPIFRKLKRAADLTYRSVEEIAATSLAAVLLSPADLPTEVADELAALHLFSDEALWAAAEPSLSPFEERRLNQLNGTAGEQGLTPAEQAEQQILIAAYHRSVLRRAQALAILSQRGHRIPLAADSKAPDNGES
jgi:hypothetical protein